VLHAEGGRASLQLLMQRLRARAGGGGGGAPPPGQLPLWCAELLALG
jgi:hypothetical protein